MVNNVLENIRKIEEEMNMQISSYLTLERRVRGDSGREVTQEEREGVL